ncbi:MAG TPA: Bifunctional glutamine synthetase adenylyltransferase/adenylyl-removing enzyme [Hyphomicrobiaceae bacterium MAG_BT-2024]
MIDNLKKSLFSQIVELPLTNAGAQRTALLEYVCMRCNSSLERAVLQNNKVRELLAGVETGSPYLTTLIRQDPKRFFRILVADPVSYLTNLIDTFSTMTRSIPDFSNFMSALRIFKAEAALLIALADLCGVWSTTEVTKGLTKIADTAIDEIVRYLFKLAQARSQWLSDDKDPAANSGYFVLAMGKHGASELNYSSDVDLIIFYDKSKIKLSDPSKSQSFFVRITRDLVRCLSEQTSNGYVFRTDLRLRPDPRSTAPAMSTVAALQYYESFGQNWERAAMIKARPAAGDIKVGKDFLRELSPFMWRKYFDYSAIADVHAMKRQIHVHRGFNKIAVAGHNIKVGRGGIREIEFFVQTQQLIAGGRQPALRTRQTLGALEQLFKFNWIKAHIRDDLTTAYCFLRRLEHRIQMIADEQTHELPKDLEHLERLAHFAGYETVDALSENVLAHMKIVQTHYSALFEDMPQLSGSATNLVFAGEEDDPETVSALKDMGYQRPSQTIAIVRDWHRGHYEAVRSEKARERLTELQPIIVEALSDTIDPDTAIVAFDQFLKRLLAGVQWFALLKANPELLKLIVTIVGSAPRLAKILSRRRGLMDAVLSNVSAIDEVSKLIARELRTAKSYHDVLDRARIIGSEQMFLICVRVLTEVMNAEQAGKAFTILAEELTRQLQDTVLKELATHHGKFSSGGISLIAMGKMGGHEMMASSDLDLIAIYDSNVLDTYSDGARPLSISHYYSKFTQLLINAFTTPTKEGILYKVDMRLRPSGQRAPIATELSGFIDYQLNHAWTWEHMALTRARVVSGSKNLRIKIESVIRALLVIPRDPQKTKQDVRKMRALIEAEMGTTNLWDIKYKRGGLIDIEFISQYLQLIHAHKHPDVLDANTQHAIRKLHQHKLIDNTTATTLLETHALLQSVGQVTQLCFEGAFKPEKAPDGLKKLLAHACGQLNFDLLETRMLETMRASAKIFNMIIDED